MDGQIGTDKAAERLISGNEMMMMDDYQVFQDSHFLYSIPSGGFTSTF